MAGLLALALQLFTMLLLVRIVMSWMVTLTPDWQPRGIMLVVGEAVYTVTDPPVKAIRRVIPPVGAGAVKLDLSVLVLFFLVGFLRLFLVHVA